MKAYRKVTIIGVGLLGGSIGLALKKQNLAAEVVGFFRNKNKINKAIRLGVIDKGTNDFKTAVHQADLVILCAPVQTILKNLKDLKKLKENKILVTDIGSTKKEIAKAAKGLNFIGAHPLAGSEQSGAGFAKADLFKKSICVLTPTRNSSLKSLKKIEQFWKHLGAKIIVLDPVQHDQILSFTSHMPHALAFSLMQAINDPMMPFAAGALKDMTRITLSPVHVWMDIFLSNKKQVLWAITKFENSLKTFKTALAKNDTGQLLRFMAKAGQRRRSIASRS